MNERYLGLPRIAREIRCPYCRHENFGICRRPASHETLVHCAACLGPFVVRFTVTVQAAALGIDGEQDRIADEQQERLELAHGRELAESLQ